MAEKTIPAMSQREVGKSREDTRSQQRYIAPPVDIYETPEGLVVLADLPGVSKEDLDVRVENDVLTIQGKTSDGVYADCIYREYELVNFFRQFELSNKVDQSKISAELKQGVLKLNLPKAEEAKPKKIDVAVN